jgi:hypothetical protein
VLRGETEQRHTFAKLFAATKHKGTWTLPSRRVTWIGQDISDNFPPQFPAQLTERVCLMVSENDNIVGLKSHDEICAVAANRDFSPWIFNKRKTLRRA